MITYYAYRYHLHSYATILTNTLAQHFPISCMHIVAIQMPSISTRTYYRECAQLSACQQRGFILDKQQWNVCPTYQSYAYQQYTVQCSMNVYTQHDIFQEYKYAYNLLQAISFTISNNNSNTYLLCLCGCLLLDLLYVF